MKNLSDSYLNRIKAFSTNHKGKNIKSPYGNTGIFKTPVMVKCLDNITRRVWCNASFSNYYLFVHMDNERVMLKDNNYTCTAYCRVNELITL